MFKDFGGSAQLEYEKVKLAISEKNSWAYVCMSVFDVYKMDYTFLKIPFDLEPMIDTMFCNWNKTFFQRHYWEGKLKIWKALGQESKVDTSRQAFISLSTQIPECNLLSIRKWLIPQFNCWAATTVVCHLSSRGDG